MIKLDRIKVLIVEDGQEERENIIDIFSNVEYIDVMGEAESLDETISILEDSYPDVVIIGAYIPGDGYKLAEKIAADFSEISTILIEQELKEETMRKAIFAGAKDVIISPYSPSKLVDSVYRSFKTEKKKQVVQRDKTPKARKKSRQGQIITVFSTKGGVGKTFVAANLAVALAQSSDDKVVLVDLDLDFGNAALALNIVPRYTIADVINDIRNLDQDLIESYLIPHRSGIKVLPANAQPQMSEFVTSEHVSLILSVLQGAFDYIVVDMPARFYEPTDPALQNADELIIVTTPEVATVRNVKAGLLALQDLNYPKAKIKVVLNKADSRGEIKSKDVETTLNFSLYGTLPADYKLVTSSLNKGIPVILLYPKAKVSRSFQDLARKVSGEEQDQRSETKDAAEN